MADENKPKARVRAGFPIQAPPDPAFDEAIKDGLGAMWSVQEKINRKLAEMGLTINDVGCVIYNPKTGQITISKGYCGP